MAAGKSCPRYGRWKSLGRKIPSWRAGFYRARIVAGGEQGAHAVTTLLQLAPARPDVIASWDRDPRARAAAAAKSEPTESEIWDALSRTTRQPPRPCDYPAEALCLVCGQPIRCDRFYLAEWHHIAPKRERLERFRVRRNRAACALPCAPIRSLRFRMPCPEGVVELADGDAQGIVTGGLCAPRPRPQIAGGLR
jgi:hypothetical protein